VLVKHSQGRLKPVRSAKPLKPRRDLGVIQVRMIAAAGADQLIRVGVAALDAAVHDADRLVPQDRLAAVAGLTGGRGCHDGLRHNAQLRIAAITRARCRDGGWTGTSHDVRITRTAHSAHRQEEMPGRYRGLEQRRRLTPDVRTRAVSGHPSRVSTVPIHRVLRHRLLAVLPRRSGHVGQPGDSVAQERRGEQYHDRRRDQPRVAEQPVPGALQEPRSPVR
jgi:hypothetical protein